MTAKPHRMDAAPNPTSRLEASIAALEAQRGVLGDAVVDAAVGALRAQLAAIPPVHRDADGERRVVTVMFADLSGFTALGEKHDAEHLRETMNACFARLTPVIQRYGGTIDKFVGDEIMALFGAPIAHEDDADRALRAALDMQEALAALNLEIGTSLGLHFGINSGPVVAGGGGDGQRRDYSVMGDAVNVAARLEGASQNGEILVGPETYRLTCRRFHFTEPRPLSLQGKSAPVLVYRLVDVRRGHESSAEAAEAGGLLVGRAAEIAVLNRLTSDLRQGSGGLAAIRGPAGIGKSRLLSELKASCADEIAWAECGARSYAQGISYGLARTLLYSLLGVRAEDSLTRIVETLETSIALTCPDRLVETYPYLARLLDLPLDPAFAGALQPLAPGVVQERTLRAFSTYLRARAAIQPIVVACEDLHWADPSSLHLIASLLPLASDLPVLFVLAYRREQGPDAFHDQAVARHGARYIILDLQPLTQDESQTFIDQVLKSLGASSPVVRSIVDRAQGNPFFLEELLRHLLDSGALAAGPDGALALATSLPLTIPATLQGVIMARVDRLAADSKATLQIASVIGREFHKDVLLQVTAAEHSSALVGQAVTDLEAKEFIRARAEAAAADYEFWHVVTQDVAYESLLLSRRRRLHEATAATIEGLFPDRLDEFAGELAHHYRNARRRGQAVKYLQLAGDRARRGFANQEAIDFYRAAIDELALRDAQEAGDDPDAESRLQERLGDVLELMARHDEARAAYARTLDLSADDAIRGAAVRCKASASLVVQRRFDEGLAGYALAEERLERARSDDAPWWRVWLQIQLGRMWVYYWQSRNDDSDALAATVEAPVERAGTPSQRAEFFMHRALSHLRRHRYVASDVTIAFALRLRDALRQIENPGELPILLFVVGFAHLWRGRLDEAGTALAESLRVAERVGDAVVELRSRTYLGLVARKRGAVAQTRAAFDRVLKMAASAGMAEYVAFATAGLGWAAWRDGDAENAERLAREALDGWHAMAVPYPFDWMAAWVVVAAALKRGDVGTAIEHAELMLRIEQQPLPDALLQATSDAVAAWKAGGVDRAAARLRDAAEIAAEDGHL